MSNNHRHDPVSFRCVWCHHLRTFLLAFDTELEAMKFVRVFACVCGVCFGCVSVFGVCCGCVCGVCFGCVCVQFVLVVFAS